jgi:hypothetical protein
MCTPSLRLSLLSRAQALSTFIQFYTENHSYATNPYEIYKKKNFARLKAHDLST